jgi:hypothetical protein
VVALLLLVATPAGAHPSDPGAQELGRPASGSSVPAAPPSIGPAPSDPTGPAPVARLTITSLTGILGPGSVPDVPALDPDPVEPPPPPPAADDLEVRAVVENLREQPLDGLRLIIEVHGAAGSRSDLRAALGGGPLGVPDHVHDVPVGTDGTLDAEQTTVVGDLFEGSTMDWPDSAGVHPIRFALVRGTTVLATVTSAVVWLPDTPDAPLPFTLALPFEELPWRTTGGAFPEAVDRSIQPGGRLDVLLGALERHPEAGVTLVPAAHLVEDLVDRADGFVALERIDSGSREAREEPPTGPAAVLARTALERLRTITATLPFEPASGPYAAADLTALQAGEAPLPDLAAQAAADGRRRLQRVLGRSVDAVTTVLPGPIEPAVLDLLPGEVVVLPYAATARPDPALDAELGPTVVPLRSPAGRRFLAVVGDPYLRDALTEPDPAVGPVLAAQRVLAETAAAHLTTPIGTEPVLAASPGPNWRPEPRFLDVLLTGIAQAPWLEPLPPSQLALAASPFAGGELLELRGPGQTRFPAELESRLAAAARDLDAARSALPPDDRLIDGREPADLRDQLLHATSTGLSTGAGREAESLVRDVQRAVDASVGDVEVVASSVTLTSDAGPVPVTLRRARGGPVVVRVEVASQGRLRFPEGRTSEPILLEEGGSQTVEFPVTAVSTGSFPLTVRVTDPDGGRELARTVVPVRSTAVSGPALAGIGAVVLVLLLLGARRRPGHRPPSTGGSVLRDGHVAATPAEVGATAGSRSPAEPHTVPLSDGSR